MGFDELYLENSAPRRSSQGAPRGANIFQIKS